MKIAVALILATTVALTNAGVGVLGPGEIDEVMRLFFRHCGSRSEGGREGSNTFIYCKNAVEPEIVRDAQHDLVVTPAPEAARQVVFIQPPKYHYRHNIQIKGGSDQPQQTRIYVLPPQISHQVQYDDIRQGGSAPAKPQLFFLKDAPGGPSGPGGNQGGNGIILGPGPGPSGLGFRNDQLEQPQQLVPTTSTCNNPNCQSNNGNANNGNNNPTPNGNNGGFAATPQVQPVPAPAESASTINQASLATNFRPVRQYYVPHQRNPSLSYRG